MDLIRWYGYDDSPTGGVKCKCITKSSGHSRNHSVWKGIIMCYETVTECGLCGCTISVDLDDCYEAECRGKTTSTVLSTCDKCEKEKDN